MNTTRRLALVVTVLMVLAAASAAAWRPRQLLVDAKSKLDLPTVFPKQFGEWRLDDRGPVQLVSPDQQALINKLYSQTLSRTYVNPRGDRVMLSVAYGGDQSDATRAHRPDVCYPAQGFEILGKGQAQVRLANAELPMLQLVARLGGRIEPVSYWFVVGERIALSGTQQKLVQLAYTTRGVIPDGLLMRVSTIDPNAARAYAVHARFVTDLYAAVPAQWRDRVFGGEAHGSRTGPQASVPGQSNS